MNKLSPILLLILLIEATCVLDAGAARAAHRPWLARGEKPVSSRAEAEHSGSSVKNIPMSQPVAWQKLEKGEQIAQRAASYTGVKYRFGGVSQSKGFDCSGLIQRIYNDLHMNNVPRTASSLYKSGKPVHLNELRPGDLVFFKNTYKRGISHVGVYAGDNRFIHAENRRRGVRMTPLSEPYYQLHYAGARRLY